MKRNLLALALLLGLVTAAHAFGLGLGDRFGKLGVGGGTASVAPSTPSVLLLNTGSALLINTGSKFLIHN